MADSFEVVGNVWVSKLHINLNDWEFGEMMGLLRVLKGVKLDPSQRDGWEWVLSKKGVFTSKSFYVDQFVHKSIMFSHKSIWVLSIPSKVPFFTWNAYLDRILTLDNLQNRGWNLANRCILCLQEEELIDHLLVHCDMTTMV